MKTKTLKSLAVGLAALGGLFAAAPAANACVTFQTAVLSTDYNPFSPSGAITQTITLTAIRDHYAGGAKTQEADFIFLLPPGANPGYQIIQTSTGQSILEAPPGHVLDPNNANTNEVELNYGGVGQPDTQTFQVTITIPINADLPAGQTLIPFDLKYYCKLTGGGSNDPVQGVVPGDLQIQVNVLSALQATFSGSALDFGEIGKLKTVDLPTTPDSVKKRSGYLFVASTGPYSVEVTSDNNFQLLYPGGNPADPNSRINYQMDFLGQSRSNASPIFSTTTCDRATLAGKNLAISATLLEGGAGKQLSPAYQDYINVTFTPLAVPPAQTPVACS